MADLLAATPTVGTASGNLTISGLRIAAAADGIGAIASVVGDMAQFVLDGGYTYFSAKVMPARRSSISARSARAKAYSS
jgi:hypothetical protein